MLRKLCALALSLIGSLAAQDPRDLSVPTGHLTLTGASSTTINTQISNGYRLTDIEYRGTVLGTALWDAVFVQNSGSYSTGWWWYTGITGTQVSSFLSSNQARLIDLEPYDDGAGNTRFACIMVDNTGANNKAWWWTYNTTSTAVSNLSSNNNARIVDLDSYDIGGTTYYSAVMISNTGTDNRGWWWYLNVTPATIGTLLNTNNARLYDLEKRDNGNWNCVMIRDNSSPAWYWWYDLTSSDILYLINNYGVRVIDIERYTLSGSTRYAIVTINNSNALTTSIGNAMRSRTNGQVGFWMERINGSNIANLNGDTQFEPASTMKTLHHTHAMRRVYLGTVNLSSLINVYTNYSSTNASCPIDSGAISQQLQNVLQLMMENSDNARTQAVRAYFGQTNINNTAAALGMASTSLNHRVGCGADAIANPNQITLRDLHTLHEAVANGYLGSYRDNFYSLMLDSVNDLSIASVINAEGASLGLTSTTIASFRNFTSVAHKGGSYGLSNGGPLWYDRAEFGYLSLPFISNDVITPREYSFGAFVNNATVDSQASAAIYTDAIPELLRPTIRSALLSWNNSLAGVQSFGTGCGSPVFTQSVSGLPRIGATVSYTTTNAYASSLALLAIGFSSTSSNGIPLPASLMPYGGGFGCVALTDIPISRVGIANGSGAASFNVSIPNDTSFIGLEYLTQFYSFGPTVFKTSNGRRSIVGL